MFETYETLSNSQKTSFADICNKLLANTYLARDKRDNKEAYYFVVSYKDLFVDFFKMINMELVINRDEGTIYLENPNNSTTLHLTRDESVVLLILRLIYHEKLKETTLNTNIVCTVGEIHDKYDMLEIRKKIAKTELVRIIRLFKRYNIVENLGDVNTSSTQLIIFPTILEALKTEEIDSIYNTITKLTQEAGNE